MDRNQGYTILKAVMLENGRGFALGEHPRAPSPFVTWACYDDEHGVRQYEWGHYGSDRAALEQDLLERVESYQQQFSVKVAQIEAPGLYKYYSTQRPVDIGTFPKPAGNEPDEIENYDKRVPVEGGAFLAWGHLTYTKPLTEKQAADYELRPAPEVSGLLRDGGRPRPIAEQMKEAARLAGERQAPAAPKRNAPDRGDRKRGWQKAPPPRPSPCDGVRGRAGAYPGTHGPGGHPQHGRVYAEDGPLRLCAPD